MYSQPDMFNAESRLGMQDLMQNQSLFRREVLSEHCPITRSDYSTVPSLTADMSRVI